MLGRFDAAQFLQVLEDAGISPAQQTRRSLIFVCPTCDKPKLAFLKDNGYFKCWHCAAGDPRTDPHRGWPARGVALLMRVSEQHAAELLGSSPPPSLAIPLPPPWTEPDPEEDAWPVLAWPGHAFRLDQPQGARGRAYLEGRGLPAGLMAAYDVRYSQEWRRVLFPMVVEGFLCGWQGRSVLPPPDDPKLARKYLKAKNSDDLPRGRAFMFEPRIQGDHVVITEGPVDALKCHEVGGNVAALGKEVTDRQVDRLVQLGVRLAYLALDPDALAENRRMVRRLRDRGLETRWVDVPEPYNDLGEMPPAEAARAVLDSRGVDVYDLIVRLEDLRWAK